MGRSKNTAQRRAQIVDALLTVMSSSGYAGASIQSIARAAELSPGLIHYHFGSKQEILLALLATLYERLAERYSQRAASVDTPWEAVEAWIDAHLSFGPDADPRAVACWVQIGAEALRQPDVRDAYRALIEADVSTLSTALARAGVEDADMAAAGMMSAVQGAYQLSLTAPGAIPPGQAAAVVRRMAAVFR